MSDVVITFCQSTNHLLSVLISNSSTVFPSAFFVTPRWHWRAAKPSPAWVWVFVCICSSFSQKTDARSPPCTLQAFCCCHCLTVYQHWMEANFSPIVWVRADVRSPAPTNRPQTMSCFFTHLSSHAACRVSCLWVEETHVLDENLVDVKSSYAAACFFFWMCTHFLHEFFGENLLKFCNFTFICNWQRD